MSFVSGMMPGLYRYAVDGRRLYRLAVLAPQRRWPTYLIDDVSAAFFEKRMRRLIALFFLVVIPGTVLFVPRLQGEQRSPSWVGWLVVICLPALLSHMAIRFWVLRGIPRVMLDPSDLKPIDHRALELAQIRATGLPTAVGLFVASLLMAIMQVVVLVQDQYWWSAPGTALFSATTVFAGRQLYLFRKLQRAASSTTAS